MKAKIIYEYIPQWIGQLHTYTIVNDVQSREISSQSKKSVLKVYDSCQKRDLGYGMSPLGICDVDRYVDGTSFLIILLHSTNNATWKIKYKAHFP